MRARNLKPGLFKNEILGSADPLLTILFEGLWCMADRAGRLEDRPLRICAELFPYRRKLKEKHIDEMLFWLDENDFIKRYEISGERYIQVMEFSKHQSPHKSERPSDIQGFSPELHRARTGSTRTRHPGLTAVAALTPDSLTPDCPIPDSLSPPIREGTGASTGKGSEEGRARTEPNPGGGEEGRLGDPGTNPADAWRQVERCDAKAYESWLAYRDAQRDPVPPAVRIEHAKWLSARGTPEQQRELVAKCIRLEFKRLHEPIEHAGKLRPAGGGDDAKAREAEDLQRAKDSRKELGLEDFRDPYQHESAAVYRTALTQERNRRGVAPGAPRFPAAKESA